jgi:peptidoglycan hydrolase CwlO-like protein
MSKDIIGQITEQDHNYITNISKQQKDIAIKIGTLEFEKFMLVNMLNELYDKQKRFEQELYEKYSLEEGFIYDIDNERNIMVKNE